MAVDVHKLQVRYNQLKSERSGWEAAYQQLAELFLPTRYRADSDTSAHRTPKINSRLVNSTGVLAMRTLAAGMQGGMTSPVRPWFRIVMRGYQDQAPAGLNEWLDEVTEAMRMVLGQSNFYNSVHSLYADLGTFGTGLLLELGDEDGVHFELIRAGEYVLDTNGRNEVDTFYRRIHMTAKQIVDRWPAKAPETIKNLAKLGQDGTKRFDVIHAVFPNKDLDPTARLGKNSKPFASVYFLLDGSENGQGHPTVLDEGGYDMFPAFAPRWDINGTDVYGRSPAMDVTPDTKMLQAMTSTLRRMQHKIADPPMLIDSSMQRYGVSFDPASQNFCDMATAAGSGGVVPIDQPAPAALQYTMQSVAEVEKIIYDGLYTDLFRMLIDDDRRNITATEIQAKQQEKMILIGPVVERLHKELLEPLIMRTFQLMQEWGAMPPPPEGFEGADLDVTFESVLAQAQKVTATSAIDQAVAFFGGAGQLFPEMLDVIDHDKLGRAYLDRIGVPADCIRDEDSVASLRQQRAEQQAQAQEAAAASQGAVDASNLANAAKAAGATPVGADGSTLMDTLLGGLGAV